MTTPRERYEHARCYARSLGDCSTKITNEHFFSEALGEQIGDAVEVSGMAWQQGGSHPDSLAKAKILCDWHNPFLSPLDSGVARFFAILRDFDRRLCAGEGNVEQATFDGALLERWFLKVLCGLASANVSTMDGERSRVSVDDAFVPPLFGRAPWPQEWRLGYRHQNPTPIPTAQRRERDDVRYRLVTREGYARGMEVRFNGLIFGLRTERMDEPGWSWRPPGIRFLAPGLVKTINLTWPLYESGYVDLWAGPAEPQP